MNELTNNSFCAQSDTVASNTFEDRIDKKMLAKCEVDKSIIIKDSYIQVMAG